MERNTHCTANQLDKQLARYASVAYKLVNVKPPSANFVH